VPTAIIDATPNGPAANSYLTLEEADALTQEFDNGEKWDELEDEDKCRLLLRGTRLIDRFPPGGWGAKEKDDQRLVFPRAIDDVGVILEGVKIALMEYVDFRLAGDLTALKKLQGEGVTSTSILGQSSSFEKDETGLPAGARQELDRILEGSVPAVTRNREQSRPDPIHGDFFG
jgi:hypothetical protein